jgi:membrane-associated protease RseP (regulator of RpoE activity)
MQATRFIAAVVAAAVVAAVATSALADATTRPATPYFPAEPSIAQFVRGRTAVPLPGRFAIELEKAAFLGVGASQIDAALAAQLDLQRGVGLRINFVEPGSPAESAGLQVHDVLQKVDDQIIFNGEQLASLIRTHKPGDTVTLTVFRKGKAQTLPATLIERELPVLEAGRVNMLFGNVPMAPLPGNWERQPFIEQLPPLPGTIAAPPAPRLIRVMPGSTSVIARANDKVSIRVTVSKGEKWLNVTGAEGAVLFDGPFDDAKQLEKLPADVREQVEAIIEGVEIRVEPATQPAEPKAELAVDADDVAT